MGECLYAGKVKEVWSADDPDILEFRYTNQISVFDQIIPSLIPRKGESLNRTTTHWFELVEKEGICRTHVVERNAPDRCLVRRVDIYREPGTTPRDGEWVFVPLEIVCRHYLAGSGWRRYKRGELTAEELGFEAGTVIEEGAKLPTPCVEVTTKFEAYDRLIDREEALEIANDTLYGLGAGIWTRELNRSYRFGRAIKAGRVWTNCYHDYPAHAAFGGYKQSGIGRENHLMMLNHYQQTKNLLVSYSPKKLGFF